MLEQRHHDGSGPRRRDLGRSQELIEQLKAAHGPNMFHLSGGCCDGSAPLCFQVREFKLGSVDEKVGEIAGCKFWMDREQFRLWSHTRWTVDVVPTGWHRDIRFWSFEREDLVSAW